MAQPVDRSILQEIVRIVEARRKVPERVQVRAREYLITYLDDHRRRLQEALQRYDSDRLNMLYGQLASKVKYQLLRRVAGRTAEPAKAAAAGKRSSGKKAAPHKPARKPAGAAKKAARPAAKKKAAAKKVAPKKAAQKKATGKKAAAKKAATRRAAVTKKAAKKRTTKK